MKNKLGIGQTCGLHLLVHKFWSIFQICPHNLPLPQLSLTYLGRGKEYNPTDPSANASVDTLSTLWTCQPTHYWHINGDTTKALADTTPTYHHRCFTFLYVIRITSGQYIFWRSTNCQMTDMSANALAKTSMGWVLYLLPYLINSYRLFMYSMTLRNKACLCFQFRSTTYAHSCRTHQ